MVSLMNDDVHQLIEKAKVNNSSEVGQDPTRDKGFWFDFKFHELIVQLDVMVLEQEVEEFKLALQMRQVQSFDLFQGVDCVRHKVVDICFCICVYHGKREDRAFKI